MSTRKHQQLDNLILVSVTKETLAVGETGGYTIFSLVSLACVSSMLIG